MTELADEQCDGNARRKLSEDSTADKIDEPPPTVSVTRCSCYRRRVELFEASNTCGGPAVSFQLQPRSVKLATLIVQATCI